MTDKKLLITIDGPSSSGKGTIAKKIAEYFNLPCLNSGGLYRALAYLADQKNINLKDTQNIVSLVDQLDLDDLENQKLHNEEIGKIASTIAKNQSIRDALLDLQKNFCKNPKGAILEGRDMGTVICPEANYKFFITASASTRADRRCKQMISNGINANHDQILEQLKQRDFQDKNRISSPLKKADDAIEIDTSYMSINEVFNKIINSINKNK